MRGLLSILSGGPSLAPTKALDGIDIKCVLDRPTQRLIATGFTVHVFVDRGLRPVRIPAQVREAVTLHTLL